MVAIWFYFVERPRSHNAKYVQKYQQRVWRSAVETASLEGLPYRREAKLFSRIYYLHRGVRDIDADNMSKPILDAISGTTNPGASPPMLEDDQSIVWRLAAKINLLEDDFELPGDPVKIAELVEDDAVRDIVIVEVDYIESPIHIVLKGGLDV